MKRLKQLGMMTMVADIGRDGQSIVEFMIGLPLLLGLCLLLIKVFTVIQMSIVSQEYARQQTLFLFENSPYFRSDMLSQISSLGRNRVVLGVSKTAIVEGEQDLAFANNYQIERPSGQLTSVNSQGNLENLTKQGNVRVRTTVSICLGNVFKEQGFLSPADYKNHMSFNFCGGGQ